MTMLRAISVARSRSFWAPVEMSSKIISSATVPASRTWMRLSNSALRHQEAVALGALHGVAQAASPRGMIETLWTGSVLGRL